MSAKEVAQFKREVADITTDISRLDERARRGELSPGEAADVKRRLVGYKARLDRIDQRLEELEELGAANGDA